MYISTALIATTHSKYFLQANNIFQAFCDTKASDSGVYYFILPTPHCTTIKHIKLSFLPCTASCHIYLCILYLLNLITLYSINRSDLFTYVNTKQKNYNYYKIW